MRTVLFLDVDSAPFLAFEMSALERRGVEIALAGSRAIPDGLVSGEFASLRNRQVVLPWLGRDALSAALRFGARRPGRTLATVLAALSAYAREPAYLPKLCATLGWTFAVARWAEKNGVSHLHANWAHLPATSAWIASRLTGLPYSLSGHAGRDLYRTTALIPEKVRDARFVVVCNRAARDQIVSLCGAESGRKIHVCHHGVDLSRFRGPPSPSGALVLSVGNLESAKGFDVMVRSLPKIRAAEPQARYRIVGDGPERPRLESLAASLGVRSAFALPGRRTGQDLVAEYRDARVFVAPSRILRNGGRDGLPNVIVEAMACGVPVVASNVAAIPEIVEPEVTGLLVPSDDPVALASAVMRVLREPNLAARLSRAATERVRRDFDRDENVRRYCDLFSSAVDAESAAPRS
jgi:glycosyltransferase involved in cell wall biosynthesis